MMQSHSAPTPSRRNMLGLMGLGALATTTLGAAACASPRRAATPAAGPGMLFTPDQIGWDPGSGEYTLPPLPYDYTALEPSIDEATMRLHHDKHHAGYVRGLNASMAALADIRNGARSGGEVKRWSRQLAFTASGHFLHLIFWNCMSPDGGGAPSGTLADAIKRDFGSFKHFTDHFHAASSSVEGSGWGILCYEPISQKLLIMQAEKHQNLTAWGVQPILALDVWEHAYYLQYQNNRKAYVSAFMERINWDWVNHAYAHARGSA